MFVLPLDLTVLIPDPELQIRGGVEDNSKIIFSYISTKTYVVTPH